jgi:hypothetical protein
MKNMKYKVTDSEGNVLCRQDLYDGSNNEVFDEPAVFPTKEQAETFVDVVRSMMHMGGYDQDFNIVEF